MLSVLDNQRRFDTVVPVLLHRLRLRRRGFNRAELLARGLANGIKSPVSDTVQVVRSPRDQVEISAAERKANVSSAFRARSHVWGGVLLVADVFTTGATMSSCAAEALLRAGAQKVNGLSLCRTV